MRSIDEIKALSNVDPELQPIIEAGSPMLAGWGMDTYVQGVREIMEDLKHYRPLTDPATLPCVESDFKVPVRDGREVSARLHKPRQVADDGCPGFVVFHGGGFAVGDLDTEAWLCRMFTELGGIAVNVDYRHAPEHVFPAAVEDAFDATKWVAENAKSLGINPQKGLLVGGESAGADLSLGVSVLYRDSQISPPLTGVYAAIPTAVNEEVIPERYKDKFLSMVQNANAPCLTAESLQFIESIYKRDFRTSAGSPLASESLGGLPKTYFQSCGLDPVRDCSLILEQVYKDSGISTRLDIYPGLSHGFWVIFPQLSAKEKHDEDSRQGLKWLLEQ